MYVLLLATVAILILLVVYTGQRVVNFIRYTRKAMKLPTDKPLPIFGHMFYFICPRNHLMKKALKLIQENEPLFTIWFGPLPYVVLKKPQDIEVILGSSKFIDKKFPYTFLKSWLGNGLVTSSGEKWRTKRKILTPAFHFSVLEKFVDIFAERSEILVKKLQKELGSDKFDIYPYINMCALEVILETAMGLQINRQHNKEHAEYIHTSRNAIEELTERALSPWLFPDFIFYLSPAGKRVEKYLRVLHSFTDKVIRERKQQFRHAEKTEGSDESDIGGKKKLSFLDLLLTTSENGEMLTDKDIRDEVDTFIIAGHDMTTVGMCWCLQMLASHPEVQERAYEELESIFHDSDRSPTTRDLNEMKYLERVIKETLRLYPSAPIIAREITQDIEIGAHTVPGGITAFIPFFSLHRDPALYPDPEKFDPDNFLPERVAARHAYAYIAFSAGPRMCIGQKFALLEMKTILSYILRNFKLEATGEVPTPLLEGILRPENGVQIKISKRVASF